MIYDRKFETAVYEIMEEFARNPSNGNRYFEALLYLIEQKQASIKSKQLTKSQEEVVEMLEFNLNTLDELLYTYLDSEGVDNPRCEKIKTASLVVGVIKMCLKELVGSLRKVPDDDSDTCD